MGRSRKRISVHLQGGEELMRKLQAMQADVADVIERATQAGAEVVADAARADAPGPFIAVEVERNARGKAVARIGPDKDHWYYRFFETGTAPHEIVGDPFLVFTAYGKLFRIRKVWNNGMAARPFLRPALDRNTDAATSAFGSVIRGVVE